MNSAPLVGGSPAADRRVSGIASGAERAKSPAVLALNLVDSLGRGLA